MRFMNVGQRVAILALLAMMGTALAADRAEARRVRPESAELIAAGTAGAEAAVAAPSAPCCPQPCIRYVNRGCVKVCCGCTTPVETTLTVVNPRTCCPVCIPVCLPGCCDGCPSVDSRCGLLGRGVVTYDWCCGFRVVVRFDRCGDVTVVYRGA